MSDAKTLFSALWAAADNMRQKMSADVYKDYLLGLVFYKNLSDKYLLASADLLEKGKNVSIVEAQKYYEESESSPIFPTLCKELKKTFGCIIKPQFTFQAFFNQVNKSDFHLESLSQAFRDIETSQGDTYAGLFDDFVIDSNDLGKSPIERNLMISSVIKNLANINFSNYGDDALGDAYEYLIAQFASESGKKAGEFYTPQAVSKLISKIVSYQQNSKEGFSIYDPCCGSGSLLLQVRKCIDKKLSHLIQFFGQEVNNQTYNLARMNMMLHKIPAKFQHLNYGDTLGDDWPQDEPTNFDACVMNPPYSLKWKAPSSLLNNVRFARYEKLAPKSAADYAFLLHGFYHLKNTGTMGIVLPHGVLFRGNAEGVIRKHLIDDGSIYAVIGLPANLFFNTGIPTCIVVLKKNNTARDILFIDASKEFVKEKARNYLSDENIEKIFNAYIGRKDIDKYAHLATYDEVVNNEYNLNIPRYVDTTEEEAPIDLNAEFKLRSELNKEEQKISSELKFFFKELGLNFDLGE